MEERRELAGFTRRYIHIYIYYYEILEKFRKVSSLK